jgi:HlyD family secretion protein
MKTVSTYFDYAKKYAVAHKIVSVVVLVVVLGGGWYTYSKATSTTGITRYVLGAASTSTIIAKVSASGQMSTSDSIDIKPKATGDITRIYVTEGQKVKAGQVLMSIDAGTAVQTLAAAKSSLAATELQYQQDSAAAPINFQKDQIALTNAQDDLKTEYTSAFNSLTTTYLDEPNAVTGLHDILYGYDFSSNNSQWNVDALPNLFANNDSNQKAKTFATSAKTDYTTGRALYDPAILAYKAISRTSSNETIEKTLQQTIDSTTQLAQTAQSELNFLAEVNDLAQANNVKLSSTFTTLQTNARSYLSTINSNLTSLIAEKKALASAKQLVTTDQQNITLDQVGNTTGSNPISLQISANNIAKLKQDIENQQANLADYTIVAPFAGVLSTVSAKVGDSAGSAAVATILSNQSIAELSLNEVDAAKVVVGQKATLTFVAIDSLILTGTVAEVDTAGTVSSGVVSYRDKNITRRARSAH